MKSKPHSKCPPHKMGPITWWVISTFAPPGSTDVKVHFPLTITETSVSVGGSRRPKVIEFEGSAVEEVYTTIRCCVNTREMGTSITLWDTSSTELLLSQAGEAGACLASPHPWMQSAAASQALQPARFAPSPFSCSNARNERVLMDPVKPGGKWVCLTAGGCWAAQGLNGLTVHPSGTAELLGMEQEWQGEIFHPGGGDVPSLHLLLHYISMI